MKANCQCGREAQIAGRCWRCYWQRVNSMVRFSGYREEVVSRDRVCRGCNATTGLIVHHRWYGDDKPEALVTLCVRCHPRVHRLRTIRRYIPALLAELWAEAHSGTPRQLQFDLEGGFHVEQAPRLPRKTPG